MFRKIIKQATPEKLRFKTLKNLIKKRKNGTSGFLSEELSTSLDSLSPQEIENTERMILWMTVKIAQSSRVVFNCLEHGK